MNARAASAVLRSTVTLATALVVATTGLVAMVGVVATAVPAQAVQPSHSMLVNDDPVDFTPHVLDGDVLAIAVIGDTVVLGGNFSKVEAASGGPVLTRNRILAFNRTTGVIDTAFAPVLDATVRTLAPGPDGQSVYVGGQFTVVNGVPASKVTRLGLADGRPVPGFSAGSVNALVYDLKVAGGRLFIAGQFTKVGGKPRSLIAELNPDTGAVKGKPGPVFSGTHNGGPTFIYKFDVNPDGRTLVAIGNFSTVGSQSRMQAVVLKVRAKLRLASWKTTRYEPACYSVFQYYVRDVEYAPNGEYFVISTTGGYGSGPPTLCDTATRWDADARGQAINPEWVAYTGGDSSYAIALTGSAVYIGGHQRWWNNPFGVDQPGQGAVPREGIAALDPVNGLPMSWDPVRARGRGVFDLVATADGLWVGSDTDRIGHFEYHGRIAFFPLAGGTAVPRPKPPTLPVDAYAVEPPPAGGDPVVRWSFDGDVPGPVRTAVPGDVDWSTVRGGFWLEGALYLGQSDGTFSVRSYDGETFGAATTLNLYGLTNFQGELAALTGLFYNAGSIYFTLAGDDNLYQRYFTVESGVVGAERFTIPSGGVAWSTSTGMFFANRGLFWADAATGDLHRIDFKGAPVAGTATVVSGPTSDGRNWRADALFVLPPAPPNAVPTAALDVTCGGTTCSFDGAASADEDGALNGYAWDFGDGDTGSGAQVEHVYDTVGSYDVTLTVTDDAGGTGTAATEVTVVVAPTPDASVG